MKNFVMGVILMVLAVFNQVVVAQQPAVPQKKQMPRTQLGTTQNTVVSHSYRVFDLDQKITRSEPAAEGVWQFYGSKNGTSLWSIYRAPSACDIFFSHESILLVVRDEEDRVGSIISLKKNNADKWYIHHCTNQESVAKFQKITAGTMATLPVMIDLCIRMAFAFEAEPPNQQQNKNNLKSVPIIPGLRTLEDPEAREMGDDSQSPIYLLSVVQPVQPEILLGAPRQKLKTSPPLPVVTTKSPKKGERKITKKQ